MYTKASEGSTVAIYTHLYIVNHLFVRVVLFGVESEIEEEVGVLDQLTDM